MKEDHREDHDWGGKATAGLFVAAAYNKMETSMGQEYVEANYWEVRARCRLPRHYRKTKLRHRVDWYVGIKFCKEHTASVFRVEWGKLGKWLDRRGGNKVATEESSGPSEPWTRNRTGRHSACCKLKKVTCRFAWTIQGKTQEPSNLCHLSTSDQPHHCNEQLESLIGRKYSDNAPTDHLVRYCITGFIFGLLVKVVEGSLNIQISVTYLSLLSSDICKKKLQINMSIYNKHFCDIAYYPPIFVQKPSDKYVNFTYFFARSKFYIT
jgi:hypothetical protein